MQVGLEKGYSKEGERESIGAKCYETRSVTRVTTRYCHVIERLQLDASRLTDPDFKLQA